MRISECGLEIPDFQLLVAPGAGFDHSLRVAKSSLGRGLSNLLGGAKVIDKPEPSLFPEPQKEEGALSSGLESLLKGHGSGNETSTVFDTTITAPKAEPESPAAKSHFPRWGLVAGDFALIALSVILVLKRSGPLRPWEIMLCIASLSLGAWMSCSALLSKDR